MRRVLTLGLVLSILPLAAGADGEKKAAPAEAGAKKAGGKKAGAKAAGDAPQGPLTTKQKATMVSRMRRLTQAGNLPVLRTVVQNGINLGDPQRDREFLGYVAFYKAGLCAYDSDEAGFWEWMEKAIGWGYLSSDSWQNFTLIPAAIKGTDRFKARIEKLEKETVELIRKEFQEKVRAGIAAPADAITLPAEGGIGPNPYSAQTVQGRPALVVVTPSHHDGFVKEAPLLEEMQKRHGQKVAQAVLFYQYFAADKDRTEQTSVHVADLALSLPAAVVGRDVVRPLEIPFFPAHFFLNPDGKVVFRQDGYLTEEQLDFIFKELSALPPKPAPVKPAEKPAEKTPPKEPAPPETAPPPPAEEKKPAEEKAPAKDAPTKEAEKPLEKAPEAPKDAEKPAEKPAPSGKPAEPPPAEKKAPAEPKAP